MKTSSVLQAAPAVTLREIARAVGQVKIAGDGSVAVNGVRQDSRQVEKGELFAVRKGARADGLRHVPQALSRGAVALMMQEEAPVRPDVPVLLVPDVRRAIADVASFVYGDPTRSLEVIGITGTNGKTTTSYLVTAALRRAGKRPGLLGTVGYQFEDLSLPAAHTTPEADDIARLAAVMRDRGASHLVMEVSSHALMQDRVAAVRFRVAAFTNLTQDHLDFHGDMAAYGEAKARLFLEFSPSLCVINVDDSFGRELARRAVARVVRVSCELGSDADIAPLAIFPDAGRTRAKVRTPVGVIDLDSPLLGDHNLSNMLVALGVCHALGADLALAASAFSDVVVPGRLERCDGPADDVTVMVDYAHTPDALDRVLSTLAAVRRSAGSSGRLLCVFGCGGDRDPHKRAPMGRAVARWADLAVVTTDNPRSEDPEAIADMILPGLAGARTVVVELDRARAIEEAIVGAKSGDVVLIAGKGHESYQLVGAASFEFDDCEHARRALATRRRAQRGN